MPRTEVSLFDAIRSYSDMSATSFLVGLACLIALADIGCGVALYGVVHHWAPESWWPMAVLKNVWGAKVTVIFIIFWVCTSVHVQYHT